MGREKNKDRPDGRGKGAKEFTLEERARALVLFGYGATKDQVAMELGVSRSTVERHLDREFKEGYALANLKLYGKLWERAMEGDTAVLIFLAKNRLGMGNDGPRDDGPPPDMPQNEELNLAVEYRFPTDANALPPPSPDRLPN